MRAAIFSLVWTVNFHTNANAPTWTRTKKDERLKLSAYTILLWGHGSGRKNRTFTYGLTARRTTLMLPRIVFLPIFHVVGILPGNSL